MTKKEVQKRVLQNGRQLDLDKFEWDEKTKTFSSDEDYLVLDFKDVYDCTFKTGNGCTFKTSSDCTFKTSFRCTFDTGSDCTFDTGFRCTFDTGFRCTFDTGSDCTFDTGSDCTFKTGFRCTFKTGYDCTFDTGEKCVVVRRDIYEVIELTEGQKIRLNEYKIKGFEIIESEKNLKGKEVEVKLGGKTYKAIIQ